jgi:hypothetical protein
MLARRCQLLIASRELNCPFDALWLEIHPIASNPSASLLHRRLTCDVVRQGVLGGVGASIMYGTAVTPTMFKAKKAQLRITIEAAVSYTDKLQFAIMLTFERHAPDLKI